MFNSRFDVILPHKSLLGLIFFWGGGVYIPRRCAPAENLPFVTWAVV